MDKRLPPSVHVLVVDDSPEILDLLTEMLELEGARVTSAGTAEDALGLLTHLRPDVLLSDLEMPKNDGLWLIEQVRALAPDQGGLTPAACLTSCTAPEDRARILTAGFQYHLAKPIDISRLIGVVGILALNLATFRRKKPAAARDFARRRRAGSRMIDPCAETDPSGLNPRKNVLSRRASVCFTSIDETRPGGAGARAGARGPP